MGNYIKTLNEVSYSEIKAKDFVLSSSQFKDLFLPNENYRLVKNFLFRDLKRNDLGIEIGSLNYINKSTHYFLRTKALQEHSYLPEITEQSRLPMMPNVFVGMNLKEGDLIISKDSNIGEIVILDRDYPNTMLSGAIYKLPVKKNKYYLLAFVKHKFFREQLDFLVPKGATIRHAKTKFLDCKIPFPNHNVENTINFIELLTQAIINKEKLIQQRHKSILKTIEDEILNNQKQKKFEYKAPIEYKAPTYQEIKEVGRLDTGLYSKEFKQIQFQIKNYKGGYSSIDKLGFALSRGQNLQESNIRKSVYSQKNYKSFYSLALPTHFSNYGTIDKIIYLGNFNKLKTLSKGEIIFGGEATFRSIVICEEQDNYITNIHGITLYHNNLIKSLFIKCFLDYLVNKKVIDCIKTGGHGGSFAQKYWGFLLFPNFPEVKQKEIAKFYHNEEVEYKTETFTLKNFLEKDNQFNHEAGIYELDKTVKQLKTILNQSIDDIINDKKVKINFNQIKEEN